MSNYLNTKRLIRNHPKDSEKSNNESYQPITLLTPRTKKNIKALPPLQQSFPLSPVSVSITSTKNITSTKHQVSQRFIRPVRNIKLSDPPKDKSSIAYLATEGDVPRKLDSSLDLRDLTIISKTDVHLQENSEPTSFSKLKAMDEKTLLDFLTTQIIGRNLLFKTTFGNKLKVYADYAASGQDLKFIMDEMAKISELYANTHSEASYTGFYMNHLLNQAENIILKECKADPKDYFIIDGGAGSTFSIEMAQKILGTYLPPKTKEVLKKIGGEEGDFDFESMKNKLREKGALPTVIVSPYEHHSNEITWRKQLCHVVEVPFRLDGFMDLVALESMLKQYQTQGPIICSFSAGSNVTGIKTDVTKISNLCKRYGAVCLYDYGGVASYVPIDMSQRNQAGTLLIDGVYISPHKFLGGPGTCGIFILNKAIYDNTIQPTHGGGGTVDYVGRFSEVYTTNLNEREKSGTPGIQQIIKCGLAFQLKGILQDTITKYEHEYNRLFFERMCKNKNFYLLGQPDEESRVTIISFNIWMNGPRGKRFIHHNLVVRLLSDVFGIQARSGCGCAGPYGHYLLGVSDEDSSVLQFMIERHPEINDPYQILSLKLGWARISLHYTLKPYEMEYIFFALEFLCKYGGDFLPSYKLDACTGNWTHIAENWSIPTLKLGEISNEFRQYARDEDARIFLLEKQKNDALDLLKTLPKSKEIDVIEELGEDVRFYVEKGLLINRTAMEEKIKIRPTTPSQKRRSLNSL